MSDGATVAFAMSHLRTCSRGERILEIGSHGSNVRRELARLGYRVTGVDMQPGPGVDLAADVTLGLPREMRGAFDVALCLEVLEHVREYRAALASAASALRPGGQLLLSAPSPGYPFHEAPTDEWRFTEADLRELLDTAEVCVVRTAGNRPGVLACARIGERFAGAGYPSPARMGDRPFLRRLGATMRRSAGAWVDFVRASTASRALRAETPCAGNAGRGRADGEEGGGSEQ